MNQIPSSKAYVTEKNDSVVNTEHSELIGNATPMQMMANTDFKSTLISKMKLKYFYVILICILTLIAAIVGVITLRAKLDVAYGSLADTQKVYQQCVSSFELLKKKKEEIAHELSVCNENYNVSLRELSNCTTKYNESVVELADCTHNYNVSIFERKNCIESYNITKNLLDQQEEIILSLKKGQATLASKLTAKNEEIRVLMQKLASKEKDMQSVLEECNEPYNGSHTPAIANLFNAISVILFVAFVLFRH